MLGLVPTAPANVLPVIVAQMPHKLRDRNTQCLYLSALFRIAEDRAGAPIREALLTAAVEHLLSLDVEIRWEDIVDVPTGEDADGGAGVRVWLWAQRGRGGGTVGSDGCCASAARQLAAMPACGMRMTWERVARGNGKPCEGRGLPAGECCLNTNDLGTTSNLALIATRVKLFWRNPLGGPTECDT